MKKIVALPGDGIGPEIMDAGIQILDHLTPKYGFDFEIERHDFGGCAIDSIGTPLPKETLKACQTSDAILLGAIGGPKWSNAPKRPEQGLLELRKSLGLFANIRPVKISKSLEALSPLKAERICGVDFIIVRELTGGIYFGEPRELKKERALDTCLYTRREIERIMRQAFVIARTRKKKVTSVDKANVLATSKLWRKVAEETAKEFPDVKLEHQLVDSAAMLLIQNPKQFDVIVTENLFGDILSDEASVIPGTLGVLPSASHSQQNISLYEPIHGSAPDIAGKNIANPLSMIFSIVMMLRESFKEYSAADELEEACEKVLEQGYMTKDLGGNATTTGFVQAVIEELK